jgi:cytidylate kinase
MIITIDGPGASGKSVIAQKLAERLQNGYRCLNTGAMYRAVGMLALRECPSLDDETCVSRVAQAIHLDFDWDAAPPRLLLDGKSVEAEIHGDVIANAASRIARFRAVRSVLVDQQSRIGKQKPNLVSEGRDQGSVVFPGATYKFFLTADVSIRAKRRYDQLLRKGKHADEQVVLQELIQRDHQDTSSEVGRLVVPADAHIIDTTDIHSIDEVVEKIFRIIQDQQAQHP